MATTITVTLNDDGTYRIDGMDSPEVSAWCFRHRKGVNVSFTGSGPPEWASAGPSPLMKAMRHLATLDAIDRASAAAMGLPYPREDDAPHVVTEPAAG